MSEERAWIEWVDEDDAEGALADLYDSIRTFFDADSVPPVVKVLSLRPEVAIAANELRRALLFDASSLGARRADMIGTAVSGINHCAYCGTAHAGLLTRRGDYEEDDAVRLFHDWRQVEMSDSDRTMIEFAEKLTLTPSEVEEADLDRLREAGFSDVNILDIVLLAAYRNFLNRINDGLGVPIAGHLEDHFGSEIADRIARQG